MASVPSLRDCGFEFLPDSMSLSKPREVSVDDGRVFGGLSIATKVL